MGEAFVIFTAAAGVLAIMGRVRRPNRREKKAQTTEQNSS